MRVLELGCIDQNSNVPDRPERVATYVAEYLAAHRGLSLGELAFRLNADKRDLQRLIRDRSCGHRLEDKLAAYFGDDFVEAVFRPVVGSGPSRRQQELDRERAEIQARHDRLHRDRQARKEGRSFDPSVLRMVPEQGREGGL
jgi:hypothetical protein